MKNAHICTLTLLLTKKDTTKRSGMSNVQGKKQ